MEFKEAMRAFKRFCAAQNDCEKCELNPNCLFTVLPGNIDFDKTEAILTKWAAEHPEKTRVDDFLDKHPKACLDDNDTPRACAKNLGYCTECICTNGDLDRCDECWRMPLEEVEG